MTSIKPHDTNQVPTPAASAAGATASDPAVLNTATSDAPMSDTSATRRAPFAVEHGIPAVLDHRIVAVQVGMAGGPSGGSPPGPVAIHGWSDDRISTLCVTPTQAQVWARAGRLTLVTADGTEFRLTVLAPQEAETATLGAHWPLGEPASRARRVAAAAAHDVGDVLTFPAWLARTAHRSGERNRQLAYLVNRICEASPSTALYYGQTVGHMHDQPDHHHPYDHKGLVGHEGYPGEL